MVPLLVLVGVMVLGRLVGYAGVRALSDWRSAARLGLAVMFVFTGSTHFSEMKRDYAVMVPPPFTGHLWVIYLTGLLEIAGAVGLLMRRMRHLSGICLFLLLLALFPANVYAARRTISRCTAHRYLASWRDSGCVSPDRVVEHYCARRTRP
jgi:uncharacterized membrane protein